MVADLRRAPTATDDKPHLLNNQTDLIRGTGVPLVRGARPELADASLESTKACKTGGRWAAVPAAGLRASRPDSTEWVVVPGRPVAAGLIQGDE